MGDGARERNRALWEAGDWDAVAPKVAAVGPRLLDRIGDVGAGVRLLDIGTGSGGAVAIPAALRGADVVGADITDAWFPAARRRAQEAGADVEWVVVDVRPHVRARPAGCGARAGARLSPGRHDRPGLLDGGRAHGALLAEHGRGAAATARGLPPARALGGGAVRRRAARATRRRARDAPHHDLHRSALPGAAGVVLGGQLRPGRDGEGGDRGGALAGREVRRPAAARVGRRARPAADPRAARSAACLQAAARARARRTR